MSELKWKWAYYPYLDAPEKQQESALKAGYIKVVVKDEADKVITEKDKEIAELKKKTEDAKATAYAESIDAGMENHILRRKLCLLRAENADNKIEFYNNDGTYSLSYAEKRVGFWKKVKYYWLNKAEEYK